VRILILGGNGMLGHQLLISLIKNHDVRVTLRRNLHDYEEFGLFTSENAYTNIDVCSTGHLKEILFDYRPDVVINAVGIIKQRENDNASISNIEINALFPHKLSLLCKNLGARLIQVSTDCVFSGEKGNYTEDDISDARDLYGRCKYLGELKEEHCLTLRTSIIGLELSNRKSLIEWFLAQSGTISGYRKAIYSGITTMEMARVLNKVLTEYPKLFGLYHVASQKISKYKILCDLEKFLDRKNIILPDDTVICDRSLNGTRFMKETGYTVPNWDVMLKELVVLIKSREDDGLYDSRK